MNQKQLILAGAAPDTGNLGVSALCYSTISSITNIDDTVDINIIDNGRGLRLGAYKIGSGKSANLVGAKLSKKLYQKEAYSNIRFFSKVLPNFSDQSRLFRFANACLDISGGDSFTDLYGEKRFSSIIFPKKIALENGIPLILLPQTYGPFSSSKNRSIAAQLLKRSKMAFARDKYSFDIMAELLGDDIDASRHQQAVDVAFMLPKSDNSVLIKKSLLPDTNDKKVFGINISGLIYNNPDLAKDNYQINIDYKRVLKELIEHIIAESDADIWLIPHVLTPFQHYESDNYACQDIKELFPANTQTRIKLINGDYDQCDIKGIISNCDWFCGTRMHSTIASLSSGVPTAAIAYSGKFKGVFESAGQEHSSFDARSLTTENMISNLISSWNDRELVRQQLKEFIPKVIHKSQNQFQEILSWAEKK